MTTESVAPAPAATPSPAPVESTPAPVATPEAAPTPAPTPTSTPAPEAAKPTSMWPSSSETETAPPADTTQKSTEQTKEHPEWFMKDKFATEADQAKAYADLFKKMGKNWGAPEDYQVSVEGINGDDPMLSKIKPVLKEMGLSQEGFNHLVKSFTEAQNSLAQANAERLSTEIVQRDPGTVSAVDKWLSESFTKEVAQVIRSWVVTPEDFQALNGLRLAAPNSTNVPSMADNNIRNYESSRDVTNEKVKYKTEVSKGLRVKDDGYESQLRQRFKDAATREQMAKGVKR